MSKLTITSLVIHLSLLCAAEPVVLWAAEPEHNQTSTASEKTSKSIQLNPGSMLSRMGNAMLDSNYRLSLVYLHDGRVDSLRWNHLYEEGNRFDKLENLQGVRREVISHNSDTYLIMDNDLIHLSSNDDSPVVRWQRQLSLLAKNQKQYKILLSGPSRIAGRRSYQLLFVPNDGERLGSRIWVDFLSGLPLSVDTIDNNGRVVEQMMTVELHLEGDMSAADFDIPKNMNLRENVFEFNSQLPVQASLDKSQINVNKSSWTVGWLPVGFELTESMKTNRDASKYSHLIFNDGMTTLSVFVEKMTNSEPMEPRTEYRGGTLIYDIAWQDKRVTVVGSITTPVADKIARSVIPATDIATAQE
ncbi:MAG: hypothetical protein COW84_06785 [Gammaproteobacteria bacterium CG22_combo_CG10-13_8_21_14_all_40_8]|nr:MAG: hypothetical protein COW84_06785 [Gammaproteobacteria bacterium CG22_combo_CG10-13_8_21_14_all_40_8]